MHKHDVSSEAEWDSVIQKAIQLFGRIDILVNNAGIPSRNSIIQEDLEGWNKVMTINATGTFWVLENVLSI